MVQYADIILVDAPDQAEGNNIPVWVHVKNLHTSTIGIKVYGELDVVTAQMIIPDGGGAGDVIFSPDTANVAAGATYIFSGYFNMPDHDVNVHIYSFYYGADGLWHNDDDMGKIVRLYVDASSPSISEFKISDYNKL